MFLGVKEPSRILSARQIWRELALVISLGAPSGLGRNAMPAVALGHPSVITMVPWPADTALSGVVFRPSEPAPRESEGCLSGEVLPPPENTSVTLKNNPPES